MTAGNTNQIWTQQKLNVYLNIAIISFVNLAGLTITILYWSELSVWHKAGLLGSFLLSIPFLSMYVMYFEMDEDGIILNLPHKQVRVRLSEIESVRVNKKMSNEYLEIRLSNAIGIRKRFHFLIDKNEDLIVETLNVFVRNGVKVYSKPTLETRVRLNPETKKFEHL